MQAAYSTFLRHADLASWQSCLERYRDLLRGADPRPRVSLPRLAEGITLAIYTRWLASLCGEVEAEKAASHTFEQLAALAATHDLTASREGILVNSVIAASRGYHGVAKAMLDEAGLEVSLEVALLIMPTAPAKRAQALKQPIYADTVEKSFLPAVYFYAHALLDLGYLEQVQGMLDDLSAAEPNSLVIDLQGKLFELRGAWAEALEVYRKSDWVVHKYRASICSIIVEGPERGNRDAQWLVEDEKLQRAMLSGGAESDQTEVVRTASFVNACRWDDFDNWLVHFELGSLSFRRRRHAEADQHLKVASQRAPGAFLFAINHLRFINLTWLGGTSMGRSLPVQPETLECGHAVLDSAGPDSHKATIHTYLARATKDLRFLAAVDAEDGLYEQAEAHELRGGTPDAFRCWSAAITKEYEPRAFHHLIKFFDALGFEQTADYLVAVAMRESWDDFFQLWELGDTMLEIGGADPKGHSVRKQLADCFSKVEQRLEELADVEFQHLMRAWRFYVSYEQADRAARVLGRAGQLAESPEEHLLLAVARRPRAPGDTDRLGLESLLRAERESTHRLERLEIACELVRYGQVTRARQILRTEGVFDSSQPLEPLEYIIALQCGSPCLSAEELSVLAERAAADLERDLSAGMFANYGDKFRDRLARYAATISPKVATWVSHTTESVLTEESIWQSWKLSLEKLDDPELLEEERRRVEGEIAALGEDDAVLFFNLTLWGYLHATLESIVDSIKRIRPDRDPAQTPISRVDSIVVNARSRTVSRLWRDYLTTQRPERADALLDKVKDFYLDERRLETQWEVLRRVEMEGPLEKAGYFVEYGKAVLELIRNHDPRGATWPPFLAIREHLLRDTQALDDRLAGQTRLTAQAYAEAV